MTTTFTPFDINPTGTTPALGRNFGSASFSAPTAVPSPSPSTRPYPAASPPGWPPSAAPSPTSPTANRMPSPSPRAWPDRCSPATARPVPWILKASMFSVEFHPTYDATIGTVEDAIRLGADAVAVGISAGSSNQVAMFEMSPGRRGGHAWGLPVVCHAYPCGEMWGDRKGSTESVLYASRAAAELGADIVKTWYTGSTADSPRSSRAPRPSWSPPVAPRRQPARCPQAGRCVVEAGGHGMTCGRNVWQAADPGRMVAALKAASTGERAPRWPPNCSTDRHPHPP